MLSRWKMFGGSGSRLAACRLTWLLAKMLAITLFAVVDSGSMLVAELMFSMLISRPISSVVQLGRWEWMHCYLLR